MTGLDLETLLRLLRAGSGAWISLAAILAILGLMAWTSWGSKRALRKCLVLSIVAHVGLVVYGASSPIVRRALRLDDEPSRRTRPERPVRITPWDPEKSTPLADRARKPASKPDWDRDLGPLVMAEPTRISSPAVGELAPRPGPIRPEPSPIAPTPAAPELAPSVPLPAPDRVSIPAPDGKPPEVPPTVAPGDPSEVAAAAAAGTEAAATAPIAASTDRLRPDPAPSRPLPTPTPAPSRPIVPELADGPTLEAPIPRVSAPTPATAPRVAPSRRPSMMDPTPRVEAPPSPPDAPAPAPNPIATPSAAPSVPMPEIARAPRPDREPVAPAIEAPGRFSTIPTPPIARAVPTGPAPIPTVPSPRFRRSLAEVPSVYRSRLDPNRSVLAQRAGASVASEQAVERALDWLARHQDLDGRWDGASARLKDGTVAPNEDSFTTHCPPGEVCFGECFYWEADSALTGLALLAYLGSGYTHLDGKHARTVYKGLNFLLRLQKPDGDLRGESQSVGMYCHAMATLALCEAYALSGDSRLKGPVERAVGFLVRSKSVDGLAWRYKPGSPDSDTSLLGWAVMALKSARTADVPIPPDVQAGILAWLGRVSKGKDAGLAFYNFEAKGTAVTPTMTAEAWACRQFLEVGGPGKASDEAAAYLLRYPTDRGEFNVYYLYYGTLAMYQHGGEAWSTWNGRVRDEVVRRQRTEGHIAGSWDPDDSPYGTYGGRIYSTALATLTLEVYYRFLRLYEPSPPPPQATPDASTRRAGLLDPKK